MELSDQIIKDLYKKDINIFFGVQGGAAARLIHSVVKNKGKFIPVLNEQAAGYAAHGYYMATGKTAGCIFTTGPGFTNGISGIAACFFDGVPMVVLVGQVNKSLNTAKKFKTRMVGFQEVQHLKLAESVSNSQFKIDSAKNYAKQRNKILNSLNKETLVMEVSDDAQREYISISTKNYREIERNKNKILLPSILKEGFKNPIILLGAGACNILKNGKILKYLNKLEIPIALTWGGQKLQSKVKNIGLFGRHSYGRANDYIFNADLVIAVGCSLLQHQAGKSGVKFARKAKIAFVNKDKNEIARSKEFFGKRFYGIENNSINFFNEYSKIKNKYIMQQQTLELIEKNRKLHSNPILPVKIIHKFLSRLNDNYIVFADAGATLSWTYQAANLLKRCCQISTAFNLHPMGYANCAAVGAAIESKKKILVIIGDGSIPMNSQELAWCKNYDIKFLVIDNQGYGIIRQMQKSYYDSNFFGSDFKDKKSFLPNFSVKKIVESYGIKTIQSSEKKIKTMQIKNLLDTKGSKALICKIDYLHQVREDNNLN